MRTFSDIAYYITTELFRDSLLAPRGFVLQRFEYLKSLFGEKR